MGFTPPQFPNLSVAWAVSSAQARDAAPFLLPACDTPTLDCRPSIINNVSALEVQYHWSPMLSVRPMASVALGSVRTGYLYRVVGASRRTDSLQSSPFVTLAAGGELSPARWLHVNVSAGYRQAFGKTGPNASVSNSGFALTSLLVLGRH